MPPQRHHSVEIQIRSRHRASGRSGATSDGEACNEQYKDKQHGHAAAFAWQVLCIGLIIRTGARLFRTVVMQSGSAGSGRPKRHWFARRQAMPS